MKKIYLLMVLMVSVTAVRAQDIKISKFERNVTNLTASANPVYDNNKDACALIRFMVRDNGFIIEPNLGILKREELPGEIRLYVPKGTKKLTVRHEGLLPLNGYVIPVRIESKVTYDAVLTLTDEAISRNKANRGHNVYAGAGYNILSLSGPSVALGFDINHHNIELGAVYGLGKTDDLYFYNADQSVSEAYHYQAVRVQLRYGYDITMTDFLSVMPQVGGALNLYNGTKVAGSKDNYASMSTFSGLVALRMVAAFSDRVKLHITPEYNFAIGKDDKYKRIADYDSTFKGWSEGFNLNVGLVFFF